MIFPITTTFLEYSSKRERKILGLLRQHKVSFLKMVHVSSSEGESVWFLSLTHCFSLPEQWCCWVSAVEPGGGSRELTLGALPWHSSRRARVSLRVFSGGFFKLNALKNAPFLNSRCRIGGYQNRQRGCGYKDVSDRVLMLNRWQAL